MTFPAYRWWGVFYKAEMKELNVPGSALTLHSARLPTVTLNLFEINPISLHSCIMSTEPRVTSARRDMCIQSNYPVCVIESYKICSTASD